MPACFASGYRGGPRIAALNMRCFGVPFRIGLGGMAEAVFPGNEEVDAANLPRSAEVELIWEDAIFFGRHWLLGDIEVRLVRPGGTEPGGRGTVRSQRQESFFPAFNRNALNFEVRLRRFGVVFDGSEAIINEATINRIPPYDSVYRLVRAVRFRARSGAAKFLFGGGFELETCAVKLMELKNIKVSLERVSETSETIHYCATLLNQTTEPNISVTWMVWPRPPQDVKGTLGSINLSRDARAMRFAIPSHLVKDRWFAVALSRPFTTNAAMSVQL